MSVSELLNRSSMYILSEYQKDKAKVLGRLARLAELAARNRQSPAEARLTHRRRIELAEISWHCTGE
jgi:hypothetical protein